MTRNPGFRAWFYFRNGWSLYFAYPITVKENAPFSRKEITEFLESKLIETRPIVGGTLRSNLAQNCMTIELMEI